MIDKEKAAYIAYRIRKAEETWQETAILAQHQLWNTCANRLYYAAFYAVTALLLQHGYETQTHKGVKILFGAYFIKTGKIEIEKGRFYAKLFDKRQASDYADFIDWKEEDILPLVAPTMAFIQAIKDQMNS
jgi:uncharacterized protein